MVSQWGGPSRSLEAPRLCRQPSPAPQNKNKGGRKTNGTLEKDPIGGMDIFPPFQKESQPFSPMEKANSSGYLMLSRHLKV
jgi:hypothetical protein